jgi:hypothetical protein
MIDFDIQRELDTQVVTFEAQLPARYGDSLLSGLTVTTGGNMIHIADLSVVPYQMNQAERDAMDRAFWRSVVVIDEGYEG